MFERSDGIFQLDRASLNAIEDLRRRLGAESSSDVISNALALLKVAVDNADPDSLVILIQSRNGGFLTVDLKSKR